MEISKKFRPDPKLRLMDQVRQVLRNHHYAYRTEQTYCDWIMRYIRYHGGKSHPRNMGKKEIEAFLSQLAVQQKVAASTQRQAPNAIVFLGNPHLTVTEFHRILFVVCEVTVPLLPTFTHRCKSPYGFVPKTTKPRLSI